AINCDNGSFLEGRWIKGARGMGQMVLRIISRHFPVPQLRQLIFEQLFHEKLLFDPDRDSGVEARHSARRESMVGLKQSLKLQERFVIKSHCAKVFIAHTRSL